MLIYRSCSSINNSVLLYIAHLLVSRVYVFTPHVQRERGKVIDRGVHIYIYIFVDEKNI